MPRRSNFVGYKNGAYWCAGCGEQYDPEGKESWGTGGYCSWHCYFLSKVEFTFRGACWQWTGSVTQEGFTQFQWPHSLRTMTAHRYFEQAFHGSLSEDMVVGHWCGNRSCVNPWHVRRLTRKQHQRHESRRAANMKGWIYIEEISPATVWRIFDENRSWFNIAEEFETNYPTVAWIKREYASWMGRLAPEEAFDVERRYAMDPNLLPYLPRERCIWLYVKERMVHPISINEKTAAGVGV
jgi:hypothetical protein